MKLDENQQENEVVSSLASHLGTNYTPTDDELVEIQTLIIEPSARIADLEVEMARKAAEYDAIVEKHARLKRLVADYRALASPMRRLPVDLLREVFYHCLPTEHNAILSYKESPAVLTRVCSTWRAVALATPALWASFHVPAPQPMSNDLFFRSDLEREAYRTAMMDVQRKRTKAMQEWLARSGACKLNISLHNGDRSGYALLNPNYEVFLETVISHSRRWRSITFITSADNLRRVAALTAEDVPALEELVINMTGYFPHPVDGDPLASTISWVKSSFLSASHLYRVSFNNLDENINTLQIRWQQLTHLSLTGMSVGRENMSLANVAALLAKCPKLVSAKLEIAYHEPTLISPSLVGHPGAVAETSRPICRNPILLPNIIDLSLQNGGSDISSLFAMLDMPLLTTLRYHTNSGAEPVGEFVSLLRRVSETLVSFTTNAVMFSRVDFFSMLKAARRLKSLSNRRGNTMEPPNPWGHHERGVLHFDDVFLGMLVGKRLGLSNVNTEGDVKPEEGKVQGVEEVSDDYSYILLPELEIFDSRIPVSFTDEGLLECLTIRQSLLHGSDKSAASSSLSGAGARMEIAHSAPYSKFKRFSAAFCRGETRPMFEEISSFLKQGLALHLSYSPIGVVDSFSPAEGIIDERASTFDPW